MVKGLELFQEHFKNCTHQFVLIGGAACDLAMGEVGLAFRATKDLDIVLCLEVVDAAFVKTFWEFVQAGKYQARQKATGKKQFYRFMQPENKAYPYMLEIFARKPDTFSLPKGSHLTPIAVGEEVSSLSAILMDDAYYRFLNEGKREVDGIPIVGPEYLIPLKAKAWLDLSERKKRGEAVDSRDINKHRNDIFRLFQIISPVFQADIPAAVREDIKEFLNAIASEAIDLKSLGFGSQTKPEFVLGELRRIYVVA